MATVDERALAGAGQDRARASAERSGMVVPRVFSTEGVSPYDQVDWDLRTAEIKDERGRVIFEQADCEVPKGRGASWPPTSWPASTSTARSTRRSARPASASWSTASPGRSPTGAARTATSPSAEDAERFYDELTALCLNQYGSFNSPVWFNVGLYHRYGIEGAANNWRWDEETRSVVKATSAYQYPQGSACFIQSVSRRHGGHHAAGHGRGHALQVRLGDRHRPLDAALEPGEALRRRPAVRPGQLHAGLRRGRQRRQVGRQDPPRRQDADAQVSGTPTSSSSSSARPRRSGRPRR